MNAPWQSPSYRSWTKFHRRWICGRTTLLEHLRAVLARASKGRLLEGPQVMALAEKFMRRYCGHGGVGRYDASSYLDLIAGAGGPGEVWFNDGLPLRVTPRSEALESLREQAVKIWEQSHYVRRERDELQRHVYELKRTLRKLKLDVGVELKKTPLARRDKFHNAREIAETAEVYGRRCGVYFLLLNDEVVYIGQSVNIYARIDTHRNTGKQFDRYNVVWCERESLDFLESAYIHALKPKLNRTIYGDLVAPLSESEIVRMVNKAHPGLNMGFTNTTRTRC